MTMNTDDEKAPGEEGELPARPAIHWNRQYYDNMAFHYWEPQHLGRIRNPAKPDHSEAVVLAKLRKMEVVLNHQMELFFRLAPDDLVRRLFAGVLGEHPQDRYRIVGREFDSVFAVNSLTQPDLLFEGQQSLLAIELKLGAMTSLEQVIKYAALFTLIRPQRRVYSLLFMGPKGFQDLWREKYASVAEVRAAIAELPLDSLRPNLRRFMEQHGAVVRTLLEDLRIGFMSYGELHALLARELALTTHRETYARLLIGMIAELEDRNLI